MVNQQLRVHAQAVAPRCSGLGRVETATIVKDILGQKRESKIQLPVIDSVIF